LLTCIKNRGKHKKATKTAVNVFRQYLEARQINEKIWLAQKKLLPTSFASFVQKQESETANLY
jgi:hypothetical protein